MDETQVNPSPYHSAFYQYGSNILTITNPEDELWELEIKLRNCKEVDGQLVPIGEPLLNDDGVSSIMGMVKATVNRVVIMSYYDKEEIPKLAMFMCDFLIKELMVNASRYNIKNKHDRDKIFYMSSMIGYACLKRAFEKNEKNFWRNVVYEVNNKTESVGQQRSLLNPLSWIKR